MTDKKKPQIRKKTLARLAAVQALYQVSQTHEELVDVMRSFQRKPLELAPDNPLLEEMEIKLFMQVASGTHKHAQKLDKILVAALPADWPLNRLDPVLRAILQAGAYELLFHHEAPIKVVISEYLDVTHSFYSHKEPAFVNGVLDQVAKQVRSKDF